MSSAPPERERDSERAARAARETAAKGLATLPTGAPGSTTTAEWRGAEILAKMKYDTACGKIENLIDELSAKYIESLTKAGGGRRRQRGGVDPEDEAITAATRAAGASWKALLDSTKKIVGALASKNVGMIGASAALAVLSPAQSRVLLDLIHTASGAVATVAANPATWQYAITGIMAWNFACGLNSALGDPIGKGIDKLKPQTTAEVLDELRKLIAANQKEEAKKAYARQAVAAGLKDLLLDAERVRGQEDRKARNKAEALEVAEQLKEEAAEAAKAEAAAAAEAAKAEAAPAAAAPAAAAPAPEAAMQDGPKEGGRGGRRRATSRRYRRASGPKRTRRSSSGRHRGYSRRRRE